MYAQTLILPMSFGFTDNPFLLVASVCMGGKLMLWWVCCQITTTQTLNPKDKIQNNKKIQNTGIFMFVKCLRKWR